MNSALRTALSLTGVGVVCFLLARASCDQILMLFLTASIGWCMWVWRREGRRYSLESRMASLGLSEAELGARLTSPKKGRETQVPTAASVPIPVAPLPVASESVRTIYKFPIHQLVRS